MSRVTIRRVGGLGRPIKGIYVDPLKHPDLEFIKKLVMLYRCTDVVQMYRCCTGVQMLHNVHALRDWWLQGWIISHSYLGSGNKVDVVVLLHSLLDPLGEDLGEALVDFEPSCVKTEAERSSVCWVVTVEVVAQESGKLVLVVDVWAGGHQVTAAQTLVEGGVISPVQLVDGKLPDGVGAGGTLAGVTVTLVWHPAQCCEFKKFKDA